MSFFMNRLRLVVLLFVVGAGLAGCKTTGSTSTHLKTSLGAPHMSDRELNKKRQLLYARVLENKTELRWLAETAARESLRYDAKGQASVMENILYRVLIGFEGARSVREVVLMQGWNPRKKIWVWQYSCYGKRAMRHRRLQKAEVDAAIEVAKKLLRDPLNKKYLVKAREPGRKATNYHANYVNPKWARSKYMTRTGTVGLHKFYLASAKLYSTTKSRRFRTANLYGLNPQKQPRRGKSRAIAMAYAEPVHVTSRVSDAFAVFDN